MLIIGSLFSGIGGLELGLERALGAQVVWQVEREAFQRSVLERHWPDADRSCTDVEEASLACLPPVDILCGGFPCQDISPANHHGQGLSGKRSGLWSEFRRLIDEFRPRAAVIENNGNRWRRWVPVVRSELHAIGYPSVPFRVCPSELGGPAPRDRVFVLAWTAAANADSKSQPRGSVHEEVAGLPGLADAFSWSSPPPRVGVADGVPHRVDRLRALGNAVSPPVAYAVGLQLRSLLEAS